MLLVQAALRQRDDEHARKEKEAEEERAHLKAQAEKERAKAALMEHDLAQAHEAARRIEEELKAEKVVFLMRRSLMRRRAPQQC